MDRRYGTRQQQGYGPEHQALRRRWAPLVRAGGVDCARCHQPIRRGQQWDLGHVDGSNKQAYAGPEHRHKRDCPAGGNRAAGSAARQAIDPAPHPRTRW